MTLSSPVLFSIPSGHLITVEFVLATLAESFIPPKNSSPSPQILNKPHNQTSPEVEITNNQRHNINAHFTTPSLEIKDSSFPPHSINLQSISSIQTFGQGQILNEDSFI